MVKKRMNRLRSSVGLICAAAAVVGLERPAVRLRKRLLLRTPNTASVGASVDKVEEIVVTSTRVLRSGYEAPTPTS